MFEHDRYSSTRVQPGAGRARTAVADPSVPPRRPLAAWLLSCLLLLAACGDATAPESRPPGGQPQQPGPPGSPIGSPTQVGQPIGNAASGTIGAGGGTLTSADGRLVVTVPAGAVAAPTTFSVQPIESRAHGGVGPAFRLLPHGSSFAKTVRITYRYDDATVQGTHPSLLRFATQDERGYWLMHRVATWNAAQRTVSVEVRHFSDWSLVAGARLIPHTATLNVGQSIDLHTVECGDSDVDPDSIFIPIGYDCRPGVPAMFSVKNWSVNGTTGGGSVAGTVQPKLGMPAGNAVYTAPAAIPSSNPVAVSVQYDAMDPEKSGLLVSHITVVDPARPCSALRNVAVWDGTLGVSYSFTGSNARGDHLTMSHYGEMAAHLTKFMEGPYGVTWQGTVTGIVRANATTVEPDGDVTKVESYGPPLSQPAVHEPSRATLSIDFSRCTYALSFHAVTAATISETNRPTVHFEASLGRVRADHRPIGGGSTLAAGHDFDAHSVLWAMTNGADAYIFTAFGGDPIMGGFATELTAGTARVSWALDPGTP